MFGHHDRSQVEVFTYSYGIDDKSEHRQRIQSESENFRDLNGKNDAQIVEQIVADKIEILVDLLRYGGGGRALVFAARPAPLLMHYQGVSRDFGRIGGLRVRRSGDDATQ